MSRLWLLLLPVLSPVLLVVGCYLQHVLPKIIGQFSTHSFFERLHWASEEFLRSYGSKYLLAICALAFLVGSILALMLHLFLPRRSGPGNQGADD